ncbi:hypothetical protein PsYK624_100680 [Phanerochaete sordida]|uniref:Serine/threonine specific protein phosphatases domain-containing protein n=1 Tax=Phanerochaete sordida TaxID=48140 RepID=A0A9P3GD48_9APHY|nr:hypothetical protein PsYK624_100680 [Phanerochaete sordida]
MEPPSSGLLSDPLQAHPFPAYGNEELPPVVYDPTDPRAQGFPPNAARGCSYDYTYATVCALLQRNGLPSVVRGHEVQDLGYAMYCKTTAKKFPSVITVFSAQLPRCLPQQGRGHQIQEQ